MRTSDQPRVRSRVLIILVIIIVALGQCRIALAAPVTLRFDAEVTDIFKSPSADIELPFDVSVGDTIQGKFTFEPAPFGHVGDQDLGIQFQIDDVTLQSPTYEILIALNQFPPIGSPEFEPFDVITVGCSFVIGPECSPKTVAAASTIEWRPFLQLSAEPPILSGGELIGDVEIWNSFNSRSLELHFFTPGIGGVSVGAVLGEFSVVPEPQSLLTLLLGGIAFLFVHTRLCRR